MLHRQHTLARSRALFSAAFAIGCAIASLSLAGCGGSPPPEEPSHASALDLLSLLPPDAASLFVVDVAALRNASFFAAMDAALEPHMDTMMTNMRELLNRIDRLAIAFRREPSEEGGELLLILARGSFTDADLETFAGSQTPGTHREHSLRRDGPTLLSVAHDHTLAFGSDRWVLAALDRLDGRSPPSTPSSPVMADAAQRVQLGQHAVTYAGEVAADFGLNGMFPVSGNAVSFGGWVDLSEPIRMEGFGLFTDAATAEAMATALREKVEEGRQSPELAAAGLQHLFDQANIVTDGEVVHVTYAVHNDTFERVIVGAMSGFVAFQSAAAEAGEASVGPQESEDPEVQPAP